MIEYKRPYRINGHAHILPDPHQIPAFMKKKEIFWVSDDREWMLQKRWKRPIDHPSYFLDGKIPWMVENKIDHEVILTLSQLYCNGYDRDLTHDVIRFQNDFNASLQHDYPEMFTACFVVQPLHIDLALKEIRRCVEDLGLSILCLPTHFTREDGSWTSIADWTLTPLFELANHYKLAIQIHPYDAPNMIPLDNQYWRFHLIWMCAQTADCHHMMCSKDIPLLYNQTRFSFAHGSQFTQVALGRRKQGYKGRPDLFQGVKSPDDYQQLTNIFFDTLVHDELTLRLMVDRVGHHQIMAGLDDPYPLGEMETVADSYPGKVIDDAVKSNILTTQQREDIWFKNVINWISPEPNSFLKRIKY